MAAKRAALASKRRSKYGATPTIVDNIRFHSAKEARRYAELCLLETAGEIRQLRLQPEFELSAGGNILGAYRADFEYLARVRNAPIDLWAKVVEDVKGFKTPLYRWKKKHVEAQYGIQIREV